MSEPAGTRAALLSLLLPGLGQLTQGRYAAALLAGLVFVALIGASIGLGRVSGRAAEVFFFMLLALPWWAFQGYEAYRGSQGRSGTWIAAWREVWRRGHDIRFLGFLLLVSALNDTWIILKNPDYLLPFYCTKPEGLAGVAAKAISPALHVAVGYGFVRLRRWSLMLYLIYAAYGVTNGLINLTCFGPGRIRNTLLIAVVVSTAYILWRRRVLLAAGQD